MFVASCDGRKANLPSRLIFQAKPFWKASRPCAFSMRSAKPIFRMLHLSVDDCERYLIPLVLAFSRSASAQSLSCQDFTASFSLNFSYLNSYQAWSLEEKSIEDSFASVITTASIAFLNSNQNRLRIGIFEPALESSPCRLCALLLLSFAAHRARDVGKKKEDYLNWGSFNVETLAQLIS